MATLYILYGSATGNAEYIAKDLAAKGAPSPFKSVVCDPLEKFKRYSDVWSKPPEEGNMRKHGLIIVCSTTGNGEAPENASRFFRYLKRKTTLDAKAMQHVSFSVLGLGDTNYDIFCGCAKSIDKKMEEAGGERIKALACADEATGLEETVEPYTETVFQDLIQACFTADGAVKEETKQETDAPQAAAAPEEKVARKTELDRNAKSEHPLFIMYGSATGNAEQIAKDLAATYESFLKNPDAYTYFPSVVCCPLNDFRKKGMPVWEKEPSNGAKHGIVVVTSTTGNGEPPENAERFVRWAKRKATIDLQPLKHSCFSVLGLGDTNYDIFCAMGKSIDKSMNQLGGTRIKPLACADEATGLESVVDPWTSSVLLEISAACQGDGSSAAETPVVSTDKKDPVGEDDGEEKKMDVGESPAPTMETTAGPSVGVDTLCSILKLGQGEPLKEVEPKLLPSIGASLSSCQLLSKAEIEQGSEITHSEDDRMTISTSSSNAVHYTLQRPFESSIINARYLSATPTDASQKASDILSEAAAGSNITGETIRNAMDIYTQQFPLLATDTVAQNIAERNGKRVIEITLALPDDFTLEYTPGDSLGLVVQNTPEAVDFVLSLLKEHHGIPEDQMISIDDGSPITVREAISSEIDLCSPLKSKRILSNLSQHAMNPNEVKALQMLASKTVEGDKAWEEYIGKQRMTFVDILREFPSCQSLPLSALLGMLPQIPPRYYSVSSSPLEGNQFRLTVAFSVVDYVTPSLKVGGKEHGLRRKKGVATSLLEVLCSPFLAGGDKASLQVPLKIFPKPAQEFRMPADLATPMILIGPGTGIGKLFFVVLYLLLASRSL